MIEPSYMFTIFMLTMGPIRVTPAFWVMTRDADPAEARALALRSAACATVIALVIALIVERTMMSWKVSLDALRISGGLLLFVAALGVINTLPAQPPPAPPAPAEPPDDAHRQAAAARLKAMTVIPLAMPTIVTPWAVVAILLFMGLAHEHGRDGWAVLGMLLLIMVLNLAGMLFARPIMRLFGMGTFMIAGWIFAVLQAGLGVEAVLISLRHLGALPPETP